MSGRVALRKSTKSARVAKVAKEAKTDPKLVPDKMAGRAKKDGTGKFEKPIRFEFDEVFSPGAKDGRYGGYMIPIRPAPEQLELLWNIADRNGAILPTFGRDEEILYLPCRKLSEKLQDDLVGDDPVILKIVFEVVRTYEKDDGDIGLGFEVIGLKKVRDAEEEEEGDGPVELD